MRFSVVIPTYNRHATLRQTLQAVLAQTHPDFEVIVVDDGSTDATPAMLPAEFPTVRHYCQANAGPAAARNRGIAEATGEIIAFTDDDCLPPPDWLARLADGFCRQPQVVGVGGPLLAPVNARRKNLLARYEAYIVQDLYQAREAEVLAGFDCPAGGTNNMAYRRAALQAIGGFDETFPYPAAEDADLKWRLAQQGHLFFYTPVTVWHLQPYTWPAFRQQQFTRGKGSVYFDRKWKRPPTRLKIAARLLLGIARWLARLPRLPELALLRPALTETWQVARGQWAALGEFTA
jgi:glycosyltransferase involved in cell wall biosynthesis